MDAKVIGSRLTELRGDRTQAEIAKGVGCSASAISMYENGERIPTDDMKLRLSKYYKKSVQSIFFAN